MKKIFSSILALAVAAVSFTSCEDVPAPYDINDASGNGSAAGGSTVITPSGSGTQADPFNVAAIKSVAASLAQGEESAADYYFKGVVSSIKEINNTNYGNATFYISDNGETDGQFYIYHAYGFDNKKITDANIVQVGDTVTIYGKITNYNGTLETVGNKAYIYSVIRKGGNNSGSGSGDNPPTATGIEVTCAKAAEIALALAENNVPTADIYTVTGYITSIVGSVSRDQQTFWMADTKDGGNVFEGYWANLPAGVSEFKVGMKVKMTGAIMKYNTTPEMKNGDVVILEQGEGGGSGEGGGNTGDGGNTGAGGGVVLNADASTVTMTAAGVTAGTETVTIDLNELCTTLGIATSSQVGTLETNGITITFDKASGTNTPIYHSGTAGIRVYGGNTMTVVGTKAIASIVAECDTYNGTFYGGQATATAEFNGSTVVYSNVGSATTQFRVKKITITYAK